jgi:hypothetical protein
MLVPQLDCLLKYLRLALRSGIGILLTSLGDLIVELIHELMMVGDSGPMLTSPNSVGTKGECEDLKSRKIHQWPEFL